MTATSDLHELEPSEPLVPTFHVPTNWLDHQSSPQTNVDRENIRDLFLCLTNLQKQRMRVRQALNEK
jgi:hypothetical protein